VPISAIRRSRNPETHQGGLIRPPKKYVASCERSGPLSQQPRSARTWMAQHLFKVDEATHPRARRVKDSHE
jgi:hypothetical protein